MHYSDTVVSFFVFSFIKLKISFDGRRKLINFPFSLQVTFWIQREGEDMLKCYLNTQLDDAEALRLQEQEFEKYYFVSMVS